MTRPLPLRSGALPRWRRRAPRGTAGPGTGSSPRSRRGPSTARLRHSPTEPCRGLFAVRGDPYTAPGRGIDWHAELSDGVHRCLARRGPGAQLRSTAPARSLYGSRAAPRSELTRTPSTRRGRSTGQATTSSSVPRGRQATWPSGTSSTDHPTARLCVRRCRVVSVIGPGRVASLATLRGPRLSRRCGR
jgi:hypothetical protein